MNTSIKILVNREKSRRFWTEYSNKGGKCFENERNIDSHIKETCTEKVTATYADKANDDEKMRKRLEEPHGQMDKLREKIKLLTKANVAGQKENYRNKLALRDTRIKVIGRDSHFQKYYQEFKECLISEF